ncbi:MAG: hypothetical protein JWM80_1882 [Cyanobacteria bacterium RYN_339]|nr:hypothetical protein [Cyanobacteria bacterium RYN_339]
MSTYLVITLRAATATVEVADVEQDPYQLVRAWGRLPRGIRLALQAVHLGALDLARLALTLGRGHVPATIRPGLGLEIRYTQDEPAKPPAPQIVIFRHPEWVGPRTTEEDVLHSP